jgi:hypothetical protein
MDLFIEKAMFPVNIAFLLNKLDPLNQLLTH